MSAVVALPLVAAGGMAALVLVFGQSPAPPVADVEQVQVTGRQALASVRTSAPPVPVPQVGGPQSRAPDRGESRDGPPPSAPRRTDSPRPGELPRRAVVPLPEADGPEAPVASTAPTVPHSPPKHTPTRLSPPPTTTTPPPDPSPEPPAPTTTTDPPAVTTPPPGTPAATTPPATP